MIEKQFTAPVAEFERQKSLSKVLLDASIVLAVSTAILFLLGWSFLDSYYASFGISAWALQLPTYAPLVASAWLIPDSVWPVVFLLVLLVALWFITEIISSAWQFTRYLVWCVEQMLDFTVMRPPDWIMRCAMYIGVCSVVTLILASVVNLARAVGEDAAYKISEKPITKVHLVFRSEEKSEKKDLLEPDLLTANDNGELMLLVGLRIF